MGLIVTVAVVVVLAAMALLIAAVIELYRDLEFVRSLLGMTDQPVLISLADGVVGQRPSTLGLPSDLDDAPFGAALFLADVCATCGSVLDELAPAPPSNVFVMAAASSHRSFEEWLTSHGVVEAGDSVIHDAGNQVSQTLGIKTSPSVVRVIGGRVASAATLPTISSLRTVLAEVTQPGDVEQRAV